MLLFPALALIFLLVALTRPRPARLFHGRYRRVKVTPRKPLRPIRERPSPTDGLRDPARPF